MPDPKTVWVLVDEYNGQTIVEVFASRESCVDAAKAAPLSGHEFSSDQIVEFNEKVDKIADMNGGWAEYGEGNFVNIYKTQIKD